MAKRKPARKRSIEIDVVMHGRKPDEELPEVALYQISPAGAPVKKLAVAKKGKLRIQEEWKKEAGTVALGPDTDDLEQIRTQGLKQFRMEDEWEIWEESDRVDINRSVWSGWCAFFHCVSGNVRRCVPWFMHDPDFFLANVLPMSWFSGQFERSMDTGGSEFASSDLSLQVQPIPIGPVTLAPVCRPLCNGVVEIYERICCCLDWVLIDPRIIDLLEELKRLVEWIPPFPPIPPWPDPPGPKVSPYRGPFPQPDPSPIDRDIMRKIKFNDATMDRALISSPSKRLMNDVRMLERMSIKEASAYVFERPYLQSFLCRCSTRKVGEAVIGPDGSFTFCYLRPSTIIRWGVRCTTTYTFKVKQWHENQWVYVYDGLGSHEYFDSGEAAIIDVNSFLARPCNTDPPPAGGMRPFVMLQDIGSTHSHLLASPIQNGEDGLNQALDPNCGLALPPAPGQSAVGRLLNRPWSMTLPLRLYVHPAMEDLGARYFRISIVKADAQGNPVPGAPPKPLVNPISWLKYVYVNNQVQVHGEGLGPHTVTDPNGTVQAGLYVIPYWDNAQWLHGQFHHQWNTLVEPNGQSLVILEIFDSQGNRLRPDTSPNTQDGVPRPFDFLHWDDPVNTSDVPHASLVHLFWLDKQPCYGDIEDLRKNGVANTEECQFINGKPQSKFSAGFRAFHVNGTTNGPNGEPFMWYYTLWYHRGLNGPNGLIQTGGDNAPPSLWAGNPAVTTPLEFSTMLGQHQKCTFALNLRVRAKHTNGSRRIHEYDRYDQAAFALEIGGPP